MALSIPGDVIYPAHLVQIRKPQRTAVSDFWVSYIGSIDPRLVSLNSIFGTSPNIRVYYVVPPVKRTLSNDGTPFHAEMYDRICVMLCGASMHSQAVSSSSTTRRLVTTGAWALTGGACSCSHLCV